MHAGAAVVFRYVLVELVEAIVHEEVGRVTGMVCDRLDANQIAALHLKRRRQTAIKISPMDGVLVSREKMKHSLTHFEARSAVNIEHAQLALFCTIIKHKSCHCFSANDKILMVPVRSSNPLARMGLKPTTPPG